MKGFHVMFSIGFLVAIMPMIGVSFSFLQHSLLIIGIILMLYGVISYQRNVVSNVPRQSVAQQSKPASASAAPGDSSSFRRSYKRPIEATTHNQNKQARNPSARPEQSKRKPDQQYSSNDPVILEEEGFVVVDNSYDGDIELG